jgi:hypothetical protein
MTGNAADLSKLRINRDQPPPAIRKAFRRSLVILIIAVVARGRGRRRAAR